MYSRHAIGSPLHVGLVPSNYLRLCPAYAISRGYAISHSQCWAPLLKKDCNGCCNLSGAVCKCISERIFPTRSLAADGSSVRIFPSSAADGVRGLSPWHTTLLARYSLLYPPATEARKRGVRRDKAPSTTGWEKAPGACRYTKSGQSAYSMVHYLSRKILSVLPLTLMGLPPYRERWVLRGEGGKKC